MISLREAILRDRLSINSLTVLSDSLSRYGMMLFIRSRYELKKHLLRQMGLPMISQFCVANQSKENDSDPGSDLPRRYAAASSNGADQVQRQGFLRRAHGYALQAPHALGGANLNEFVYRKSCRTRFGAFPAIDACALVAGDADGTEHRDQPHQGTIRTQIATPEVLHQYRRQYESDQRKGGCAAHEAEEIEHADIDDKAVGAGNEVGNRFDRHHRYRVHEKSQK